MNEREFSISLNMEMDRRLDEYLKQFDDDQYDDCHEDCNECHRFDCLFFQGGNDETPEDTP